TGHRRETDAICVIRSRYSGRTRPASAAFSAGARSGHRTASAGINALFTFSTHGRVMPTHLLIYASLFAAGALLATLLVRRRQRGAESAATINPGRHTAVKYFAVLEFDRFITMRNTIGFEIANRVLAIAGERVRASLREVRLGRTGP